ncbi:MAG: hypothetical protein ACE5OZ_12210 [Candidatus Heimdallarchaeota archaeon]
MNWKDNRKGEPSRFILQPKPTVSDWLALQDHRKRMLSLVQTGKDEIGTVIPIDEVIAIMQVELTAGNLTRDVHPGQWENIEVFREIMAHAEDKMSSYTKKTSEGWIESENFSEDERTHFKLEKKLYENSRANILEIFTRLLFEGYASSLDIIRELGHSVTTEEKGQSKMAQWFKNLEISTKRPKSDSQEMITDVILDED